MALNDWKRIREHTYNIVWHKGFEYMTINKPAKPGEDYFVWNNQKNEIRKHFKTRTAAIKFVHEYMKSH